MVSPSNRDFNGRDNSVKYCWNIVVIKFLVAVGENADSFFCVAVVPYRTRIPQKILYQSERYREREAKQTFQAGVLVDQAALRPDKKNGKRS